MNPAAGAITLLLIGCAPAPQPTIPTVAPEKVAKLTVLVPSKALQYRSALTREATFVFGTTAPIPLLAGQIQQESSWDCKVTAADGGMGCAQFMKATAGWLVTVYPELGSVNAYDPVWAFQAQARLDKFNLTRVKGVDECNQWAAALLAYNAGLGIAQGIQKLSPRPDVYWGVTEIVKFKQSEQNHKSSRDYPHRIVYHHQPLYESWGRTVCL